MNQTTQDQVLSGYLAYLGDGDKLQQHLDDGANPRTENSYGLARIAGASSSVTIKREAAQTLIEAGADIKECPIALIRSLSDSANNALSLYYIEQGADVHFNHNVAFAMAITRHNYTVLTRLAQYATEPVDITPFVAMAMNEDDSDPETWEWLLDEVTKYPSLTLQEDALSSLASESSFAWYLNHRLSQIPTENRRAGIARL